MYYVYLLRSDRDKRFYIGQTKDVVRRLEEHNAGKVRSTRPRRPFTLVGCKEFPTRDQARYFEYEVKHHSDKKEAFVAELCGQAKR